MIRNQHFEAFLYLYQTPENSKHHDALGIELRAKRVITGDRPGREEKHISVLLGTQSPTSALTNQSTALLLSANERKHLITKSNRRT